MSAKPEFPELAQYLEGALTQSRAAEIAALVASAPEVRAQLETVQSLMHRIGVVDPAVESLDLLPGLHAAIARQPAPRSVWRWLFGAGLAAGVAAFAALVLIPPSQGAGGFHAKGGSAPSPAQWAGIAAYRVEHGQPGGQLGQTLHADQALAISYRNAGEQPYPYLAVFAVDARGQVFWFYPAWTHAEADPSSVDIRASEAAVMLPDAVQHAYQPGPLHLHALFTRRPLHVSEIETKLHAASSSETFEVPEALDQKIDLSVVP